jgi:hypothetical protein
MKFGKPQGPADHLLIGASPMPFGAALMAQIARQLEKERGERKEG